MNSGFAQEKPSASGDANTTVPSLKVKPARIAPSAQTAMMLAAASAGSRIVAVGERGVVLLSDDAGKSFHQAASVPISATLTSVHFIDTKNGWAAGHWGAILKTGDAGETWQLLRSDTKVDQPLFSIYFKDARNGWAAGLWSLLLSTSDGGATWQSVSLPVPAGESKADRNLFAIFSDQEGGLAITAERGTIVHSADGGSSWTYIDTGYKGSLWAGTVLQDGTWMVGGLRGTMLRSADHGKTWHSSPTGTKSSLTGIMQAKNGAVIAVGFDGVMLTSRDNGMTFSIKQRPDRASITAAVLAQDLNPVTFSQSGPMKDVGDTVN
ncbi:glycosyl hydrolase [Undibacterium sp. CY7W]|uniref:Glycosyl hydrolase n=2 Tax=Undibacterium rugosum TaxID=2762291 RepID=A0A923I5G5_9BURK|nr:glycosyl hydrolase [Undibacterium rugosum]MBR7779311.1 glycosyl hydrolase [Undibacterium rugosum]